jgi:hypothetical protein
VTFSYSPTIPNPPNDPADDVSVMQTNAASIASIIDVDHVGFNIAGGGQHEQVTFNANKVPSIPTSPPVLFTDLPQNHGGNPALTVPELFFYSGNASQSSDQYSCLSTGSVLLFGGIIMKWGFSNIVKTGTAITFSNAFPNNCFGVQVTVNQNAFSGGDAWSNIPSTAGFTAKAENNCSIFWTAIGN